MRRHAPAATNHVRVAQARSTKSAVVYRCNSNKKRSANHAKRSVRVHSCSFVDRFPLFPYQVVRRNEIDYDLSACVALFQITNSFGRFTQAVTPVDYWRYLSPRGRRSRWWAASHFISSLTAFTQPLSRQRMRRAARMCDWEV